jgi:hypothetical protein
VSSKLLAGGIAAIALLAAGLYAGSPYWTVYQIRSAAAAGDYEGMNENIDYPALRENLKGQFTAHMGNQFANDKSAKKNAYAAAGAAAGAALGVMLVERLVETLVTPSTVAALLRNGDAKSTESAGTQSASAAKPVTLSYEYRGVDRFEVSVADERSDAISTRFLFRRRGVFHWDLVGVIVPQFAAPG